MEPDDLRQAKGRSLRKIKIRADLPRLEVPVALDDGRIPLEALEKDLEIQVPSFSGIKAGDEFKLYLHQTYFGTHYIVTDEDESNPGFVVPFSLEKRTFPPDGSYLEVRLEYEYVEAGAQEGARSGKVVTILFDLEPPGGSSLRALGFTQEQKEGITQSSLIDGYLTVPAYAWFGMDGGDVITPWVSELPASVDTQDQYFIHEQAVEITAPGTSTKLLFPAASFRGVGNRYFAYQLRDKLGNTSKLSLVAVIPVDLPSIQ